MCPAHRRSTPQNIFSKAHQPSTSRCAQSRVHQLSTSKWRSSMIPSKLCKSVVRGSLAVKPLGSNPLLSLGDWAAAMQSLAVYFSTAWVRRPEKHCISLPRLVPGNVVGMFR
eukprot:1151967-Pelagomonas_calceolata.AAC.2